MGKRLHSGFHGENGQDRVSRFGTGLFESFHQTLGHSGCPWLSGTWPRGARAGVMVWMWALGGGDGCVRMRIS